MVYKGNTKAPMKMAKVYRHRWGILEKEKKEVLKMFNIFGKDKKFWIFSDLPSCAVTKGNHG